MPDPSKTAVAAKAAMADKNKDKADEKEKAKTPHDVADGNQAGGRGGGSTERVSSSPSPSSELDIFVGNLSLFTDESSLKEYFERYGKVNDVRVMHHNDSKKSRRFGFVTFEDAATVQTVLQWPEKHFLAGKYLETNYAIKKPAAATTRAEKQKPEVCPEEAKVRTAELY